MVCLPSVQPPWRSVRASISARTGPRQAALLATFSYISKSRFSLLPSFLVPHSTGTHDILCKTLNILILGVIVLMTPLPNTLATTVMRRVIGQQPSLCLAD